MENYKVIRTSDDKYIKVNPKNIKIIETDQYVILFDPKTGEEILTGINGVEDPFSLQYPSMLDIGIMGHCDNDCGFCYQGDKWQENMPLDAFKLIVDQSKDYVNQIALGGRGDPNQHENFEEILKYSSENRIVPNYTTSGINLTDEQIAISKKYCGAVAVSMYNKSHTWSAIQRLMDAGVKTNIHFVFTKHSANIASSLIQGTDPFDGKVNFEKLNAIVFLLFKPQGKGKNLKWEPTRVQLDYFARIIEHPKSKFKIGMDSCLINKVSQMRPLTEVEEMFSDTCEGARMSCYITPDLKLMPCSFGDPDKYGIDISSGNIQEVWKTGKPFIDFRDILFKTKACCPFTIKGF